MDEAQFKALRQQHARMLAAAGRLESVLDMADGDVPGARRALLGAVAQFLGFHESTLAPHFAEEERDVYPLLERYLDAESRTRESLMEDHGTIRGLVGLLRQGREALLRGEPEAEAELTANVHDLVLLLRDHIRKEDGVVHPLLRRLQEAGRG